MNRREFLNLSFGILAVSPSKEFDKLMSDKYYSLGEPEPQIRSVKEITERCLALLAVTRHPVTNPGDKFLTWLNNNNIQKYFTIAESAYFNDANPEEQKLINFSWKVEALAPLLWSIGYLDSMPAPNEQFGQSKINAIELAYKDIDKFISQSQLRAVEQILETEDTY